MELEQKSEFYCDGGLKSSGEYLKGTDIKNGKWKSYFSNGNLESEGYYENDKKNGEWFFYFNSGKLKSVKLYKVGKAVEEE